MVDENTQLRTELQGVRNYLVARALEKVELQEELQSVRNALAERYRDNRECREKAAKAELRHSLDLQEIQVLSDFWQDSYRREKANHKDNLDALELSYRMISMAVRPLMEILESTGNIEL